LFVLNSDGHQFRQYQQNKQSPLNSDGHQLHQYQQNKQSPLNKIVCFVDIGGIVDHHCLVVIVCFVDIGGIDDHHCLEVTNINKTNNHL
jgi:hypothetical protein